MKLALYSLLLVLSCQFTHAQMPPATPTPVVSASSGAAADTVQAIKRLFARRRNGAWVYSSRLPAYSVLPAIALFALETNPLGLALVGTSVGVGIGKFVRFSEKKEAALIEAYQQGTPLPASIRKRLKPKYWQ